eukprot:scaffold80206_cov27-Tisochrysis_lutea.AAC.4
MRAMCTRVGERRFLGLQQDHLGPERVGLCAQLSAVAARRSSDRRQLGAEARDSGTEALALHARCGGGRLHIMRRERVDLSLKLGAKRAPRRSHALGPRGRPPRRRRLTAGRRGRPVAAPAAPRARERAPRRARAAHRPACALHATAAAAQPRAIWPRPTRPTCAQAVPASPCPWLRASSACSAPSTAALPPPRDGAAAAERAAASARSHRSSKPFLSASSCLSCVTARALARFHSPSRAISAASLASSSLRVDSSCDSAVASACRSRSSSHTSLGSGTSGEVVATGGGTARSARSSAASRSASVTSRGGPQLCAQLGQLSMMHFTLRRAHWGGQEHAFGVHCPAQQGRGREQLFQRCAGPARGRGGQ